MCDKSRRQRYDEPRRCASSPQRRVDERPANPAVSIGERVDGLELGMRNRSLHQGGEILPVGKCDQIVHVGGDCFVRWWYVERAAWRVVAPADPVLNRT